MRELMLGDNNVAREQNLLGQLQDTNDEFHDVDLNLPHFAVGQRLKQAPEYSSKK